MSNSSVCRGRTLKNWTHRSGSTSKVSKAGRVQVGLEWHPPFRLRAGTMGWYGAIDLNAFEENDWGLDTALQGGIAFPVENADRTWRLAATLYDGRSLIGEFFRVEERYLSIGLWLDL